jgi:hypothetical protein
MEKPNIATHTKGYSLTSYTVESIGKIILYVKVLVSQKQSRTSPTTCHNRVEPSEKLGTDYGILDGLSSHHILFRLPGKRITSYAV